MATTSKEVFDFKHYKDFLQHLVGPRSSRKGVKSAMARALRCQPTYVSQVLHGAADFSLEQAEKLAEFFGLTDEGRHFFLLLVQKDRAGTKALERYFAEQIEAVLARRLVLTKRLGESTALSTENQAIYYSSWHYAAVHMAVTIPDCAQPVALAMLLGLPLKRVAEVLEFLARAGLVIKKGAGYAVGNAQVRLGNQSHHIIRHHANWRQKAVESLDRESIRDLHYSGVFTLSQADVVRLKDKMLEFIGTLVKEVRESKEEAIYAYTMDFFGLERS